MEEGEKISIKNWLGKRGGGGGQTGGFLLVWGTESKKFPGGEERNRVQK